MASMTVVIPAYNAAPWLGDTLRSVREQRYTDFRCLVIDDGSTDNTAAVFARIVGDDHRFCLKRQPRMGVCAARNLGIRLANTTWITFLDSDDIWHPSCLERMTAALSRTGVRLVWCHYAMFYDGENLRKTQSWTNVYKTGNIWWDMLLDAEFCMGAWAARTADVQAVNPFDPNLAIAEDRNFLLELLARCCSTSATAAAEVPEELLYYRQRSSSAVRNGDLALKVEWDIMRPHLEHQDVPAKVRLRGYSFLAFKMAVISAFAKHDLKAAFAWYVKAIVLCPFNMNLYVLPLRKLWFTLHKKESLPWLADFLNKNE